MIELKELSKNYRNTVILEKCNSVFEDGRISFIMGKNGCGKTTLIKCMCDLESFSGDILFDGRKLDTDTRKSFLTVWDDCTFYQNLSGIDNLMLLDDEHNKHNKEDIKQIALNYLSPEKLKKKVGRYSYGQKKLLSLALVELMHPKILIMDEITNGLDYSALKRLKVRIKEWKKDSLIILTGHNLDFYTAVADDLFILKDQKIVKSEKSDKNFGDIYDKEFS